MDEIKTLIPIFITGSSKEDLVKKMAKYNMSTAAFHKVINIHPDEGGYTCWFYENVTMRIKEEKEKKRASED